MRIRGRIVKGFALAWAGLLCAGFATRILADCASFNLPFTDLGNTGFCAQIAEAYYAGLANGTSATTFNLTGNVSRVQMAAFITRTLDKGLSRGSRRAALQQFWTTTPAYADGLGAVSVGTGGALLAQSDGESVWVSSGSEIYRIHASDGRVEGPWTGATNAFGVLCAMGRVFVAGASNAGALFMINPSLPPTAVTLVSAGLGDTPNGITFDGHSIWTANVNGSVSRITPTGVGTWGVSTFAIGGAPRGATFDGANVWIADAGPGQSLRKLDGGGAIAQSVVVGQSPGQLAFDGSNIWVPNFDDSVTVVRASDGVVLRTLTGNGLFQPRAAAFDGQRVLVTNNDSSVSLFQATSLAAMGNMATGLSGVFGACSDGRDFWVVSTGSNKAARF